MVTLAAPTHHRSVLRGAQTARPGDHGARPVLLELEQEDFLPRLLAELATPEGYRRLLARRAGAGADGDGLRLYQPVHRVAHVVLVEAVCDQPGDPPLARRRIAGAGMVVRRVAGGGRLRWVRRDGVALGWAAHPAAASDDEIGYEPDAARRAGRGLSANARVLAAAGALLDDGLEEVVAPLFPAPAAVCAALGRTVLYGVVPTASAETTPPDGQPPFDATFIAESLPGWVRAAPKTLPPTGSRVTVAGLAAAPAAVIDFRDELARLLGTTGLGGADAPADLVAAFAAFTVTYIDGDVEISEPLAAFVARAVPVLLERRADAAELRFPDRWEAPTAEQERAFRDAAVAAVTGRWQRMAPATARFAADPAARFTVTCFVRVRDECGCALRTRWSPESDPFAIAPWFDGPARPPVRIDLPDLGDLRKLKPNVAFALPPALRKQLDGMDMQGLLDGRKPDGKWEFGMICSFSIPIITLCAFIVLSIFLSLLNIVFWWLLWVKICLPFPKKSS